MLTFILNYLSGKAKANIRDEPKEKIGTPRREIKNQQPRIVNGQNEINDDDQFCIHGVVEHVQFHF
jgi:hypothetical protein